MKMPEFIPFHFDKFNQNLFRKHGAVGVGRWCLIKKAVAETPTLTINLNDISDRETLELDSGCSERDLTELLDYAAQRGMIDAQLYSNGLLWIENLDTDLGRFFKAGKRHLPKRPQLHGKIPLSSVDFSEKFQEDEQHATNMQEKFLEVGEKIGIPTHETKRNETNERNEENARERISEKKPSKQVLTPTPEQPQNEDEEMSIYVAQTTAIRAAIPKLVKAYGKEGKPGRVEQEFGDAARLAAKEYNIAFQVAVDGIVHKAGLCFKYETETEPVEHKFRQAPENWLHDQCWKKTYGKSPDGKPSQEVESPILAQIKKDMAARAWEKQQAIDEAIAWNERNGNTQTTTK